MDNLEIKNLMRQAYLDRLEEEEIEFNSITTFSNDVIFVIQREDKPVKVVFERETCATPLRIVMR